jgi:hypothetical protein
MTIRAFIEHCVEICKKPATIRRYVATITRAHLAAGLTSLVGKAFSSIWKPSPSACGECVP